MPEYAERDPMELDRLGNHYCRHVEAMTAEGLHEKSDIAAELGYRDARIAILEGELSRLKGKINLTRADGWDIDEAVKKARSVGMTQNTTEYGK